MGLPRTPKEAVEALKKHGQQRYIDGDYTAALTAFNQALKLCGSDNVEILNGRAATYCKLANPHKALEDGRRMIKIKRHDHRGYLRTASVLRSMDKPDKALEVLRYALRTLPTESKFYKDIVKTEKDLSAALYGPPVFDPTSVLPFEILRIIMFELDTQDRLLLRHVSRSWRALCLSMPELYRFIDFRVAPKRKRLTFQSIRTFGKFSNDSPSAAALGRLSPEDVKKSLQYLSRCGTVQRLSLECPIDDWNEAFASTDFKNLRVLSVCSVIAVKPIDMRHFVAFLSHLEYLEFWVGQDTELSFIRQGYSTDFILARREILPPVMPHLQTLALWGESADQSVALLCSSGIPTRLPALQTFYLLKAYLPTHLDLSGCSNLRRFGLLDCSYRPAGMCTIRLPVGLEHLSFSETDLVVVISDWRPLNFKSLQWNGAKIDSYTLREFLMKYSNNLLYLDLDSLRTREGYKVLLESIQGDYLQSVVELHVGQVPGFTSETVNAIVEHMPNLKRLDISGTAVDGSSIVKLAIAENLKLDELICHGLVTDRSYTDAVQFARDRGIRIPVVKREAPRHGIAKCPDRYF